MFIIKFIIFTITGVIAFGVLEEISDKFLRGVYAKNYVELSAKKIRFRIRQLDFIRLVILLKQISVVYLFYIILFKLV